MHKSEVRKNTIVNACFKKEKKKDNKIELLQLSSPFNGKKDTLPLRNIAGFAVVLQVPLHLFLRKGINFSAKEPVPFSTPSPCAWLSPQQQYRALAASSVTGVSCGMQAVPRANTACNSPAIHIPLVLVSSPSPLLPPQQS